MKKILLSAVSVGLIFAAQPTNQELVQKLNDLQKQIEQLQAIIKKNQQAIKKNKKIIKKNKKKIVVNKNKANPFAANDHLYWGFDLRTSYDDIVKKTTDGDKHAGQVLSNRVILSAMYKPSDNLKANLKLSANKVFGVNYTNNQDNDWVTNETPDDDTVRVKEAFFNYFFGPDNGLMFSAGRRPATEGFPANLREDDLANSPLSHSINMEFDGFSFRIGAPVFAKLSDKFSDWGTTLKFCAGRGASNVNGKWTQNGQDYTKQDGIDNADLVGVFFVPYNDDQYAIQSSTAWVFNVAGYNKTTGKMQTVGDDFIEDITLSAIGVGDGISDFLDDTTAYFSYAYSVTNPKDYKMLGSNGSKSGQSILVGADMPAFDDDRFGLSFAKGSKYWRSFTYGEDTLAGSMAAVRGNAYDVYYTHKIIPHLSAQIRYTYLDYKYPGSEAFFGDAGDPTATNSNYVTSAQDLRLYVRYKF
jgi:hypothetical protein